MQEYKKALQAVHWPTSEEVTKKFGLVLIVLLTLLIIIGAIDGIIGYLLGYIY